MIKQTHRTGALAYKADFASSATDDRPSIKKHLHELYKRVHPDKFHAQPFAREANEKSFKLLQANNRLTGLTLPTLTCRHLAKLNITSPLRSSIGPMYAIHVMISYTWMFVYGLTGFISKRMSENTWE